MSGKLNKEISSKEIKKITQKARIKFNNLIEKGCEECSAYAFSMWLVYDDYHKLKNV